MFQRWILAYPLRWFDELLNYAVRPFSKARTMQCYATNGYYLMGIVLAALSLLFWSLGLLGGTLNQLPVWLHDSLVFLLGLIGLKDLPGKLPLVVLLVIVYWVIFFIKPARLFIGEKFANIFFGTVNVGIAGGELCLEHRWTSLFIVIGLAGVITWGAYYLFETTRQRDMLISNFGHWLDRVDNFSNRSTVSISESDSYKQVKVFWKDDYHKVIKLPNMRPHPAFTLHSLLDELYPDKPLEKPWHDFLREKLPQLIKYMKESQLPERDITPSEKRAWALMNILMGRIYVRLSDKCDARIGCSELVEAEKYFSAINEQYKSPQDKQYLTAAQNGMGTVYANAFSAQLRHPGVTSPELQSICGDTSQCASRALEAYAQVEGEPCSFEGRRRENNTIDTLARIGINVGKLHFADINISKACGGYVKNEVGLANCIESQVKKLMSCAAHDPFIPLIFVTAAQSYGVSIELKRKVDPNADVDQEVVAAGKYLRLAYVLNKGANDNMRNWELCYFRFAINDEKLGAKFLHAVTSGIELPSIEPDYLMALIRGDMARCQ